MADFELNQNSTDHPASNPPVPVPQAKKKKQKGGKAGTHSTRFNALRHGLASGQLPKGCTWVSAMLSRLRRALEEAVIASKGEVSLMDACFVSTAIRWERHAALAQRWLRITESLTVEQQLAFSREIAIASTNRDKSIERLGIQNGQDVLAALYRDPKGNELLAAPESKQAATTPENSSQRHPRAREADDES